MIAREYPDVLADGKVFGTDGAPQVLVVRAMANAASNGAQWRGCYGYRLGDWFGFGRGIPELDHRGPRLLRDG